ETLTGAGMAVFYPASQALLPRLVPDRLLQEASALSRPAMNPAQMAGAAIAGVFVAAAGPGGALSTYGDGKSRKVALPVGSRGRGAEEPPRPARAAGARVADVARAAVAVGHHVPVQRDPRRLVRLVRRAGASGRPAASGRRRGLGAHHRRRRGGPDHRRRDRD